MKKSELQIIVDYYESLIRSIYDTVNCDDDIYRKLGGISYLSDPNVNADRIEFILDHNLPVDFYTRLDTLRQER